MKFSIDKNSLLTKLQLLSKAIPTRTTLPIIGSALFTHKKNILNIIESIFDIKFENDFKEEEREKNIKKLEKTKKLMRELLNKQLEDSFKEASLLI